MFLQLTVYINTHNVKVLLWSVCSYLDSCIKHCDSCNCSKNCIGCWLLRHHPEAHVVHML